jgi:hypothetical protein
VNSSVFALPHHSSIVKVRDQDLLIRSPGSGSWIRTSDLRVMSPTSYHCSIPRRIVLIALHCTESCCHRLRRHGHGKGGRSDPGTGLCSHAVAHAVSSALRRFTSVFGMGTGGSISLSPPRSLVNHASEGSGVRGQGSGAVTSLCCPDP